MQCRQVQSYRVWMQCRPVQSHSHRPHNVGKYEFNIGRLVQGVWTPLNLSFLDVHGEEMIFSPSPTALLSNNKQ